MLVEDCPFFLEECRKERGDLSIHFSGNIVSIPYHEGAKDTEIEGERRAVSKANERLTCNSK